jgi:hypothetical protein
MEFLGTRELAALSETLTRVEVPFWVASDVSVSASCESCIEISDPQPASSRSCIDKSSGKKRCRKNQPRAKGRDQSDFETRSPVDKLWIRQIYWSIFFSSYNYQAVVLVI